MKAAVKIFEYVSRKLEGTHITRFRTVGRIYTKVFRTMKGDAISMENVRGNKMFLDLSDNTSMRMYMFKLDKEMVRLVQSLKPGQTFVDVGAHVGYFTLLAAKAVGSTGHVYAFEPEPKNNDLLNKNVALNDYKNVLVKNVCISKKTGRLNFYLSNDSGTHSTKLATGRKIVSAATSLDDFCKKEKIGNLDMIKIDVEGGEIDAFRGMKAIVKKSRKIKILSEFVPSYVTRAGGTPQEYVDCLKAMGFKKFYLVTENSTEKIEPSAIVSLPEDIYNILSEKP